MIRKPGAVRVQVADRDMIGDVGVGEREGRQKSTYRGVPCDAPAAIRRATTVAPTDFETDASWKTVSESTFSLVTTSRTPNPLLYTTFPPWMTATAIPGTPEDASKPSASWSSWATASPIRPSGTGTPAIWLGITAALVGVPSPEEESDRRSPLQPEAARMAAAAITAGPSSARRSVLTGRLLAVVETKDQFRLVELILLRDVSGISRHGRTAYRIADAD